MKNNSTWFSIVVAMWLVLLISLTALLILSYIIPFSRSVKGIENASNAYYQAETAVEESLYFLNDDAYELWGEEHRIFSGSRDFWYEITASGSTLPVEWFGNSEDNENLNILSLGQPIQIEVGNDLIDSWNNVRFVFKLPRTVNWTDRKDIKKDPLLPIIGWKLSSWWNSALTLSSTGSSHIYNDNITSINASSDGGTFKKYLFASPSDWEDGFYIGENGERIEIDFQTFYNSECDNQNCKLNFTLLRELEATDWSRIPYLEYRILLKNDSWTNWDKAIIPLQYSIIEWKWQSYGFKKELDVRVSQQRVNEALDFAVFQ